MAETVKFFEAINLEINKKNSATNTEDCEKNVLVHGAMQRYKYLGITENRESKVGRETYDNLRRKILDRVDKICKTRLNRKNTVKALNRIP